jgi:hypothetical protein
MEFATAWKLPSIRGFCALRPKNHSEQLPCRLEFTSDVRPASPEKTLPQKHTTNLRRRILRSGYRLASLRPRKIIRLLFTGQVLLYADSDS